MHYTVCYQNNALTVALGQYDWSMSAKKSLLTDFFINAIRGLGTGQHYEFIEKAGNVEVIQK